MPLGTVQKVAEEYVMVKIDRQDMCGECHACEVVAEKKSCELKCVNRCDAKTGDTVDIDLSQDLFIKATAIMYGIPLVGLFLGILMGTFLTINIESRLSDGITIGLGLLFMGVGLWFIKARDKKQKYNQLLPIAKKVIRD